MIRVPLPPHRHVQLSSDQWLVKFILYQAADSKTDNRKNLASNDLHLDVASETQTIPPRAKAQKLRVCRISCSL